MLFIRWLGFQKLWQYAGDVAKGRKAPALTCNSSLIIAHFPSQTLMKADVQSSASPHVRMNMVKLYHATDAASELSIYALAVFCPWAFGTTQQWSIWAANIAGDSLGLLLLFK